MRHEKNPQIKIPKFPIENGDEWFQLGKDTVFVLRAKQFANRMHEIESKFLKQNERIIVHVRFVKEVEICATTNTNPNIAKCEPLNALEDFVKESGYYDDLQWFSEILNQYYNEIPNCPDTKTFYLYKVMKIP